MELSFRAKFRGTEYANPGEGVAAAGAFLGGFATEVHPQIREALNAYLQAVAAKVASRASAPWPGGTTPTSISSRSGEAVTAIQAGGQVDDHEGGFMAMIRLPEYLAIQEKGGTLRASSTEYLAIPLRAALSSSGVPLKPSPRDWGSTFVQRSRQGNLLIFLRRGRQIIPLYLLRKEVHIPARLGYFTTLSGDQLALFMTRVSQQIVAEFMSGG